MPIGVKSIISDDAFGPKGVILWEESISKDLVSKDFNHQEYGLFQFLGTSGIKEIVKYHKNDMYYEQAKYFVECILNGRIPTPSGEDGVDALSVALRVLE